MAKDNLALVAKDTGLPLWELEVACRTRVPLRIETSLDEALAIYASAEENSELRYAAHGRILFHVGYLITWAQTPEAVVATLQKMPFADSETTFRGHSKILELATETKWPLYIYKHSERYSGLQKAALRKLASLSETTLQSKPSR
jgi:hypothetical protein